MYFMLQISGIEVYQYFRWILLEITSPPSDCKIPQSSRVNAGKYWVTGADFPTNLFNAPSLPLTAL